MSLPPGFLDELRSRTSLAQVVGRKVTWDARKSNQGKGDFWAPCPFHQEKTASFHVDDRKGYYYCFGCQAKGDAISFVRETENVDFIEAIQILAAEAGLTIPERDPQARQKADRHAQLSDLMETATRHFRMMLKSGAGTAARDYLTERGLPPEAQDRLELGFAPDEWQGLWDHLKGRGVADDLILDCGLAKPSQKGGKPYDTFRNRIMFPIRDARGRCIAFGGRAMNPADAAKYLNSPETELFDKSRTLYNHGPAREAAGKSKTLIVAEGYMDVIALAEAGFTGAVAPLGTAVTEHQLAMLWRIADEPIVALDGDAAGLRAAYRVIDLALPRLEAGKSLRFAMMPDGQDPDSLLKRAGPVAVQELLDAAVPLVDLLWRRETEGRLFDSPERRAALDKVLREKLMLIRDPGLRRHYGQAVKDLRWHLFRPQRSGARPAGARARQAVEGPSQTLLRARTGEVPGPHLREAVILATILRNPGILTAFEASLEALACDAPGHAKLRDAILRCGRDDPATLESAVAAEVGEDVVENLFAMPHLAVVPAVRRPDGDSIAEMTVTDELGKLDADRGHAAEVAEAQEDITGFADEAVTWRLSEATHARHRAWQGAQDDQAEFDRGDNGAQVNRAERDRLNALLEQIDYTKGSDR